MISWLTSVANVPNSVHKSLLVAPAIYGLLVRKLYEVKELIQERCGRYSQIGGGELGRAKGLGTIPETVITKWVPALANRNTCK